ncbi:MAG: DUF4157 domain-containing protein [Okeania sp. SIO3H1]|nr:DUF4157 domain-containing protein [Okeania sp. SIO3H1]
MGNQRTTKSKTTEANHQGRVSTVTQPPLSINSPVHPILQLQQKLGNQAVNRLIQTKMTVGPPGDIYEQEADQVAATVMRTPAPQVQHQTEEEEVQTKPITPLVQQQSEEEDEKVQMLQRQSEEEDEKVQMLQRQSEEEDEKVQMLQRQAEEDEKVQAKAVPGQTPAVSPHLESKIQSRRGTGQPLPESTRAFMEPRFGADFSRVRVHTDSSAVQMNKELGAQAFTHGNDVYFNSGKFNPESSSGKKLLAHELTHTIQQTGGVQAKLINKKAKQENKIQAKAVFPVQRKEATVQQQVKKASPDSLDNLEKSQQAANSQTPVAREEKNQTSPQNQDSVAPEVNATVTAENSTSPQEKGGEVPPKTADAKAETSLNQETKSPESGNQESTAAVSETTTQETAPVTPDSDPDFQAVVSKAKGVANKEKQHAPADTKAKEAQDAAESPASEVESKAQGNQVGEMAKAPAPAFNAAAFKAKLMERIKEAAPKNLKQADNFKNNNKLGAVKSQMQAQVKQEQTASQAPLEEKTKQAPDTSGIEPKSVTPLPPNEAGAATQNIGAEKAVPKAKGQGEVEAPLQESSQKLEQQMAEANVTEEQLAKSNEPQFQTALGAKQEASKKAKQAPQEYRQFEQNQLTQAQGKATATAEQKLQGMNGSRAQLLSQVTNQQVGAKGKDEQARAKVAGDIKNMYQGTKTSVENILKGIEGGVMSRFNAGTARAKKAYENYVAPYMEDYKSRYDGIVGAGRWLKDQLLGVPPEVTAFFDKGRKKYLNEMDITLTDIANYVTDQLNQAKEKIAEGRKEIQEYVDGLPGSLQQVGQDAANNIEGQFDRLEQSVDDKNNQLIDTLSQAYTKNLEEMDARIKEMKASNQPWFAKAFDALTGVIETINKLKNMLMNVLAKVADTVTNIIKDPIGFLGNLVKGIKQGFENFVGNIGQHLQAGLIGWLTGTLGPMGIELPDDIFSLPGIFSLVTQVLGLTFSYIRGKAVKLFGEPVVAGMEKGVEIFQVLRDRGVMGLWEYVKEQFNDLKETVIGEIKNMVITQVITAGVKWILSLLNPASAFVKAAMAIYDIIMFFVNRGSQVLELVNAVVDAVAAIASGAVGGAAKLVENALSRALPVAIGFLASVAGISGLAKKVEGIIGKIRQRVDKAIDKVLLKAKGLFKGKKGKKKSSKGDAKKIKEDNKKVKPGKITSKDKTKHDKIADAIENQLNKPTGKNTKTLDELYKIKTKEALDLEDKYQPQLKQGINLTIQFYQPKNDTNKIRYEIIIKPNNLIEEHFIGDDSPGEKETLMDWPDSINNQLEHNKLSSLKGQKIPKTLHVRIHQVKKNMLAISDNNKLSVLPGNNKYSYKDHAVYLKIEIIQSINRVEDQYLDAVVHEFDHAVRINTRNRTVFDEVKSEIFAFHAQMLTWVGLGKSYNEASELHKAKLLKNYVELYKYGDNNNSPEDRLKIFFEEVYKENGQAKKKLAQLIAFLNLGEDEPSKNISMDEIAAEESYFSASGIALTIYTNL